MNNFFFVSSTSRVKAEGLHTVRVHAGLELKVRGREEERGHDNESAFILPRRGSVGKE